MFKLWEIVLAANGSALNFMTCLFTYISLNQIKFQKMNISYSYLIKQFIFLKKLNLIKNDE
jgi:hypothetical protein